VSDRDLYRGRIGTDAGARYVAEARRSIEAPTFVKLEELKPGIKVLFTTGYAVSVLPEDFAARGARLLSKPYKLQHLLGQIRELLDSART
jgi:hypothetical protein